MRYIFKIIETEVGFTKTEINNEWNVYFIQNKRCFKKLSRLNLYLPRQKWIRNETLILFELVLWVFNAYSSEFSIGQSISEFSFLILCEASFSYFFLYPARSKIRSLRSTFSLGNKKNIHTVQGKVVMACVALVQTCVLPPKLHIRNVTNWRWLFCTKCNVLT